MKGLIATVAFVLAATISGAAHFVFVVPDQDRQMASVLLSEALQPDAQVDVSLVAGATLSLRTSDRQERPLHLTKGEHAFSVSLPTLARGVIHGVADLGVMTNGSKPHVLLYYPKAILGDAFDPGSRLGAAVPVEIVPVGRSGAVQLDLVARGTPVPNAEVTVLLPDGSQRVVKTNNEGRTDVFSQAGRYGAWARYWETKPGERNGQRFEELRHYATLVFDVTALAPPAASNENRATRVATLPEATASFGAAVADGWLYVYGGHVSPTHVYSTSAVSGRFSRLQLHGDGRWETLPPGPSVQGMNLAAYRGQVYRVGGMQPQNPPGEPEDTRSIADVSRFDPTTRRWDPLPPLPAPRSSHDVAIVGDKLFVFGGWNLRGKGTKAEWPTTMEVLDLASPRAAWTNLPQPFKRRAFIAAADDTRIYILGGFDEQNRIVHGVDIYDVVKGTWSTGPALPGGATNGFGPAAAIVNGRVVVSIDDGSLYRLAVNGSAWDRIGEASPRIVHRLVADGNRVFILGGARAGANLDSVEALNVQP